MRLVSTLLLWVLGLGLSLAQKADHEVFPLKHHLKSDTISWKQFEAQVSISFRLKAIDYITDNFFNFVVELSENVQNTYYRHFYFVELNGDTLTDVVFEGWSGLNHKSVMIFKNIDNHSFVRLFDAKEIAIDVKIENQRLQHLTVVDFGNDMEYLVQEVRYVFDSELNSSIRYVRAYPNEVEFPDQLFEKPFKFRINTPLYTLRLSPLIDNEPRFLFLDEVRGNTIGVFREGNIGYVWGQKTDSNQEVWWFVEMMPVKKISQSLIYISSGSLRALGWMKAELLQKVK
jgi:hypothetical protein